MEERYSRYISPSLARVLITRAGRRNEGVQTELDQLTAKLEKAKGEYNKLKSTAVRIPYNHQLG